MDKVINLRQQRKAKSRSEKEKKAAENRLAFGQTKQQKQRKQKEQERIARHLDGHLRETEE